MNLYTLALFLHLVGVLGIFVGIGVWFFAALGLRYADEVAQVRILTRLTAISGNVAIGGVLLIAGGGFYMAFSVWGWQIAWIDVATVSFALLAPMGVALIDPRIRAIGKAAEAAAKGPLPPALSALARGPLLRFGLSIYLTTLLGIVYLMTAKPALTEALVAMIVAAAVGVPLGMLVQRAARPHRAR